MNPFLIEPYSCWNTKPAKKKHLHQLIEEEALMARIIAEQQARSIAEAKTAQMTVNDSVQNGQTSAQTAASPAVGAGAGGVPTWDYFHISEEVANFSFTPATSQPGPVTIVFANHTPSQELDTYLWDFGDGTTTSTEASPTHLYTYTGSFTASMTATYKDGTSDVVYGHISASSPRVSGSFYMTSASKIAPVLVTFTNTSIDTSHTPTTIYSWSFGDNTGSLVTTTTAFTHEYSASTYTVTLRASGSFSQSAQSQSVVTLKPNVTSSWTASFAGFTPSGFTGSFSSSTTPTYWVSSSTRPGVLTGTWDFGDFTQSVWVSDSVITHRYSGSLRFTASLSLTESIYNFATASNQKFSKSIA